MGDAIETACSEKSTIRGSISGPTTATHPDDSKKDRLDDSESVQRPAEKNGLTFDEHGEPSSFPDGGLRAWLVIFGVSCGVCATFGFVNAWGVFQAYYEQNLLQSTPPSNIAWIGSIQYALVFIPGIVCGRLFDMGWFRLPMLVASAVLITATFLVAQCTEYWQFILCQGIAVGISCGAIFGPTMGVIPHWFHKRLNLAYGVMAIGSSFGGTVFPIIVRNLILKVGFQWTMRIVAFLLLLLLGTCNLLAARRLPPKKTIGPFLNLHAFRNPAYSFYCASAFTNFLGLYTILTYIDVSAQTSGLPETFSFYLLPIANASSGCGRLAAGLSADRAGQFNVMIPFTFVCGVITFVWPLTHTIGAYVVIAIIYGFTSGVFASLVATPIVGMGSRYDVGSRVGMAFTILAMGALAGPPISGAIFDATGTYKWVGIYAGAAIEVAVVLMLIARWYSLKGWIGKI